MTFSTALSRMLSFTTINWGWGCGTMSLGRKGGSGSLNSRGLNFLSEMPKCGAVTVVKLVHCNWVAFY